MVRHRCRTMVLTGVPSQSLGVQAQVAGRRLLQILLMRERDIWSLMTPNLPVGSTSIPMWSCSRLIDQSRYPDRLRRHQELYCVDVYINLETMPFEKHLTAFSFLFFFR